MNAEDKAALKELAKTFGSDMIRSMAKLLDQGLSAGKTSPGEGLLFTMLYADILHGGAYRWGTTPDKLPYYQPDVQGVLGITNSPELFWLGTLGVGVPITIPQGFKGAGKTVRLPAGASTLQAEVILDGWNAHILPQLISDQTYIQVQERAGQMLNTILLQQVGTGVTAFAEAGSEFAGVFTTLAGGMATVKAV